MVSTRLSTALVVIAILFVTICYTANALPRDSRILGGDDAAVGQYSWIASVRVNNAHVCGGTIISAKHILTAASCVSQFLTQPVEANRVSVRVGSTNQYSGGLIVNAKSINIHPSYGNFLHNIAVITLASDLAMSDKIAAVELPAADEEIEDNASVTVTGWGLQGNGATTYKLQHTTLKTISVSECEYQAGFGYDSTLCLQHDLNKGVCRGDEGSGVILYDKIIGIISFAFGGCGTKYPDVSSRVPFYSDWIKTIIA